MLKIGLTGGIGSGKSTVAALLVAHGAALVDTDLIARQITQAGGVAMQPLVAAFGAQAAAADGSLDRAYMRQLAFTEPEAKRRLEAILHPLIGAECDRQAAAAALADVPVLVFDVPLLVESQQRWRARVDRVLVVDASEATQTARVMARSGWSAEAVARVIAQQASRAARRAAADAVIVNEALTREQLAQAVGSLWRQWVREDEPTR